MKITVIDGLTDTAILRDATAEEELQITTDQELSAQAKAEEVAKAEARATQKAALLDRLGISEDEAKLLLA
jgi:hypothetical protein